MVYSRRFQQGLWFVAGAVALTVAALGFQQRQSADNDEAWPWEFDEEPPIPRPQAITFSAAAVVNAPADALERLWKSAESLPLVLRFLHRVERVDDAHARWTLRSTMGQTSTLDLRVARAEPLELMSWDVSGDGVTGTVTVEFSAAARGDEDDRTMATRVAMSVDLRTTEVSAATPPLEQFFGDSPSQRLADDLRRLGVGIERGLLKVT